MPNASARSDIGTRRLVELAGPLGGVTGLGWFFDVHGLRARLLVGFRPRLTIFWEFGWKP